MKPEQVLSSEKVYKAGGNKVRATVGRLMHDEQSTIDLPT